MYISKELLEEMVQTGELKSNHVYRKERAKNKPKTYDIFLSYSFVDKEYALQVAQLFQKFGFTTYLHKKKKFLDKRKLGRWKENKMYKILKLCTVMIFLATPNTLETWLPWELEKALTHKEIKSASIPIVETKETKHFIPVNALKKINYIDYGRYIGGMEMGPYKLWVNRSRNVYVEMWQWIHGGKPYEH